MAFPDFQPLRDSLDTGDLTTCHGNLQAAVKLLTGTSFFSSPSFLIQSGERSISPTGLSTEHTTAAQDSSHLSVIEVIYKREFLVPSHLSTTSFVHPHSADIKEKSLACSVTHACMCCSLCKHVFICVWRSVHRAVEAWGSSQEFSSTDSDSITELTVAQGSMCVEQTVINIHEFISYQDNSYLSHAVTMAFQGGQYFWEMMSSRWHGCSNSMKLVKLGGLSIYDLKK